MAQSFNLKNIRTLLMQGFSDEELRNLCYDNPEFRPVYDQLSQGMGKATVIQRLLEYAEQKELLDTLLAVAKELNPTRYETHQPYYYVTIKPAKSRNWAKVGIISVTIAVLVLICLSLVISPGSTNVLTITPSVNQIATIPIEKSIEDLTEVTILVKTGDTGKGIPGAQIAIKVSGQASINATTNSQGNVTISIAPSYVGQSGELIVEANGFQNYRGPVDIVEGVSSIVVPLGRLLPPVTVIPTPAPIILGKLAIPLKQQLNYKVNILDIKSKEILASIDNARQPALNFAGTELLVNGTGGLYNAITRMTSTGQQPRTVSCSEITAESQRPAWSPDGQQFLFDSIGGDPRARIYIDRFEELDELDCNLVDNALWINGGELFHSGGGVLPLWSPDNRIFFRGCNTWTGSAGNCGIWWVNPDGSEPKQWTENPNHIPTSANSNHLIYMEKIVSHNDETNQDVQHWEIYVVDLRNGTSYNLSNSTASDIWGTLSPDGRTVAFLSDRSSPFWDVWLANIDGSNVRLFYSISRDLLGEVDRNQIAEEHMSWSQ